MRYKHTMEELWYIVLQRNKDEQAKLISILKLCFEEIGSNQEPPMQTNDLSVSTFRTLGALCKVLDMLFPISSQKKWKSWFDGYYRNTELPHDECNDEFKRVFLTSSDYPKFDYKGKDYLLI